MKNHQNSDSHAAAHCMLSHRSFAQDMILSKFVFPVTACYFQKTILSAIDDRWHDLNSDD